jgi:hypothetical protein
VASREEILTVIKKITGDPTSGAVAEISPAIADGIAEFLNPPADTPAPSDTRTKTGQETRLMNQTGETR